MSASVLCLLASAGLVAQTAPGDPVPPAPDAEASSGDPTALSALEQARAFQDPMASGGLLAGGLGFERLGEDWFARLDLLLAFDWESFGFGLQLPVRFRVIDEDPQNDDDLLGLVRSEDWDSVGDVLKILRYVYVGQRDRRGPYYFRLGLLDDLTLGHGTIVHRYRNDVDVNQWRVGFEAAGRYENVGARAFVGDLSSPYLSGLRVTARPLEMAFGDGPFLGLVAGASLVVDASAPLATCLEPAEPVEGDDPGCITPAEAAGDPMTSYVTTVDDEGRPTVAADRALAIVGLDVGYELLQTDRFRITPYVDLNKITAVAEGWGLHAGVLWSGRFPALVDTFVLDLRTEYRAVSGDYVGPYVNATYDIERYTSLRASSSRLGTPTKLGFLCGASDGDCVAQDGRHGYFLELLMGLPQWIFVGGELLDYTGEDDDGTFRLTLEVPALEVVQLTASYFRVGVRDLGDLFAVDDRSAILARARVPLYSLFALDFEWSRVWRGDPDGGYAPVDDWRVGAGFAVAL
jgi:hypothetical protein